jgi:DUF4097 and DUF4098 domain-containing protein YvlB
MVTILAVHALLSLGAQTLAVDTIIPVSRGARLEIEANAQAERIEVRAWDRDEVGVESAAQVRVSTTGALVRLVAPGGRSGGRRASYQLSVPRWMPITVSASGADVTVQGADADVAVETVGGSIRLNGGNGRVSAHSVGGSVTVEGAQGRVDARSFNQGVRLIGVSGEVRAESSNGSVRLERVESSDVVVSTINGSVDFDGAIRSDGVYRLSTHNGQVTMTIPEGSNATVSVSTQNGRYSSSFPVQVTQMGSDRRITFVLGDGSARIEASSFNGNIGFRRPGQPRP